MLHLHWVNVSDVNYQGYVNIGIYSTDVKTYMIFVTVKNTRVHTYLKVLGEFTIEKLIRSSGVSLSLIHI